jgi:hypothetical protein
MSAKLILCNGARVPKALLLPYPSMGNAAQSFCYDGRAWCERPGNPVPPLVMADRRAVIDWTSAWMACHATRGIRPTEEEARRAAFLDVEESDAGSVRLTAIM